MNYSWELLAAVDTAEDLHLFTPHEAAVPLGSRMLIEVPISPDQDIASIITQINAAGTTHNIQYWPENPGIYASYADGKLFIMYATSAEHTVSPAIAFLPILMLLIIIGPILLYFLSPMFRDIVNAMILMVVMMFMMDVMKRATPPPRERVEPAPPPHRPVKAPPIEQRIVGRIESIANSIERLEAVFKRSEARGASQVTQIASEITKVARDVKRATEDQLPGDKKARAAERLTTKHRKLREYEEKLTPRQRQLLEEERQIVEELRTMYD